MDVVTVSVDGVRVLDVTVGCGGLSVSAVVVNLVGIKTGARKRNK